MISRIFVCSYINTFAEIPQKRKTVSSSESDDDIPLASLRKKMRASATKKRKKAVPKSKPAPKAKGKTRSGPVKKTVSATAGDSYDTVT